MKNFTVQYLLTALLLCAGPLSAQVTINVRVVPDHYTPLLDDIFIAGNFNLWAPCCNNNALTDNGNGTYTYVLQGTQGQQVEYKYTRGTWPDVETQANGSFLPNRSFIFNNGQVINDTIWNWEDMAGNHTASGNMHMLDLDFNMPQLGRNRRIWVYLPRDYYTSNSSYPVLYMHDGQNLFDALYTFLGVEWAVDEAMETLQDNGFKAAIVVGMDNGGIDRINEYSPLVSSSIWRRSRGIVCGLDGQYVEAFY